MGDDFARHGQPDRNHRIDTKPTTEIGEQQLTELLHTDDGDAIDVPDPSPRYAHTKRRGAPIPPWEEWDDAGPHFASDLVQERADVATIAMRRFRAPVASTIDPPNATADRSAMRTAVAQPEPRRPRPSTAPQLHRHGVVTMAPLSPLDAPSSSSSNLPAPAQLAEGSERLRSPARLTPAILPSTPAPDPYAAAYSYQPHLARIQRVPEHEAPVFASAPASEAWESLFDAPPPDEPIAAPPLLERSEPRPRRFAKASEPRDHDDWVVLVTHRNTTEAIDPVDIVDSLEVERAAHDPVPTVRIPDIASLVAAADAQAAAADSPVQTDRITDIAGLLAAADAQAAAFEAAVLQPANANAAQPASAAQPSHAVQPAHIGEIEAAFAPFLDAEPAPDVEASSAPDAALDAANVELAPEAPPAPDDGDFAIALEPAPAPTQPAPIDPATEPTSIEPVPELDDCRGVAPAGTRSVEIPVLTREPADAAHHEPSIIIAHDAHDAPALVATPSLQMWQLDHEPDAPSPTAEQVIATALRDLVALDAAMPRNHVHLITPHPTWIPHRPVRPRHVFVCLGVLLVILGVLYALASVIF